MQTKMVGKLIETILVPSDDIEQYKKTPWFFAKSDVVLKGGPGSGFEGHPGGKGGKGNPGGSQSIGSGKSTSTKDIADEKWIVKNVNIVGGTKNAANLVRYILSHGKLPINHLKSLKKISIGDTPSYMKKGAESFTDFRGNYVVGAYGVMDKRIYLHEKQLEASTIYHEFGHHIYAQIVRAANESGTGKTLSDACKSKMKSLTSKSSISKLGLRSYSFTDASEFFSDCFSIMTLRRAYPEGKAMAEYWKGSGFEDIFSVD